MNYVSKAPLSKFLGTKIGRHLWDSYKVKLVCEEHVIVEVSLNAFVDIDEVEMFKGNEFSSVINNYIVEAYTTIDEVNYIFVIDTTQKEAKHAKNT